MVAGIGVVTPKGAGWEYSIDQVSWQTSRVFLAQADGSPFVRGTTYTVYCQNLTDNTRAINVIVFGLSTSNESLPVTLDIALQNGADTQIVPYFEGGLAADLSAAPAGEIIQEVVVGSDGTFYAKPIVPGGLEDSLDTPEKKDLFLRDLLNAMSEETHTILCEKNATCPLPPVLIAPVFDEFEHFELIPDEVADATVPVFDQFDHFELIPDDIVVDPPVLGPLYMVRLDGNNCSVDGNFGVIDGWIVDRNHPDQVQTVRIKRDGVFRADVVATIDRPDVRDYLIAQGLIPPGTTFAKYGYTYPKLQSDRDGQPHDWRVYAGTSNLEANSETGATNTITCGLSGPTISQQVIGGVISLSEGENGTVFVTNNYSDGTQGRYTGPGDFSVDTPYPDGVTITPTGTGAESVIAVPANCISQDVARPLRFTFPGGRSITQAFLFKNINPPATDPNIATGDSSIASVAIWWETNDQVWFLYKSSQSGNQGLEDNWPPGTLNVMGNTTDFLPSIYSSGQRPSGYESYQYLNGYSSMSADMLTALQSLSTLTIRKSDTHAVVLQLQFTAKNLTKGEVRPLPY